MARAVAVKDLRQRTRDRTVWILGLVAPAIMAIVLGLVWGGDDGFSTTIAVVDRDGGAAAEGLFTALDEVDADLLTVVRADDRAVADALITDGEARAGIVVPPGFSDAVADAGSAAPTLTVLTDPGADVSAGVAVGVAEQYLARLDAARIAVATTVAGAGTAGDGDAPPVDPAAVAAEAAQREPPLRVVDDAVAGGGFDAATRTTASMIIFFAYFVAFAGVRSLLEERGDGMLRRVLACPVAPGAVLAGTVLAGLAVSVSAVLVVGAVTTPALGLTWGDPIGVALLAAAVVLAATGVVWLIGVLAGAPQRAEGYMVAVTLALGTLGGNFVYVADPPTLLAVVQRLTPNGWALEAVEMLSGQAATFGDVLPQIAAVAAFGLVTGGLAWVWARRVVLSP